MAEVVLVDIHDNEVGVMEKIEAHKLQKLHRAFSLFIISGDKMLLQRRAINKYHSGGKWANACCSHPRPNEEIKSCIVDRAKDELGIRIDAPTKLFDFIYYSDYNNGIIEYELDNVFVVKYDGEINYNRDEVMDVKWVSLDDLANDLIANPSDYSTWFLSCAPRVIKYLKKLT